MDWTLLLDFEVQKVTPEPGVFASLLKRIPIERTVMPCNMDLREG